MEPCSGELRPKKMLRYSLTVAALLLVAACSGDNPQQQGDEPTSHTPAPTPAGPTVTTTAGPRQTGTEVAVPPPFVLKYPGHELALNGHTWCYRTGCVDGIAEEDRVSVGSPGQVRVRVPVKGWKLTVSFRPTGERCGRTQSLTPMKAGDDSYIISPVGHAATYDVDLFARGRGGDVAAAFRWTTTVDGKLPLPGATMALIANHDGSPDSYGVEFYVENLATTPDRASARITVTAANGKSLTFDATRSRQYCQPEGTVFFDGPDSQGLAAARLGKSPFRYDVSLRLAGKTYRSAAIYPRDEMTGNEPNVELHFVPALPAMR